MLPSHSESAIKLCDSSPRGFLVFRSRPPAPVKFIQSGSTELTDGLLQRAHRCHSAQRTKLLAMEALAPLGAMRIPLPAARLGEGLPFPGAALRKGARGRRGRAIPVVCNQRLHLPRVCHQPGSSIGLKAVRRPKQSRLRQRKASSGKTKPIGKKGTVSRAAAAWRHRERASQRCVEGRCA